MNWIFPLLFSLFLFKPGFTQTKTGVGGNENYGKRDHYEIPYSPLKMGNVSAKITEFMASLKENWSKAFSNDVPKDIISLYTFLVLTEGLSVHENSGLPPFKKCNCVQDPSKINLVFTNKNLTLLREIANDDHFYYYLKEQSDKLSIDQYEDIRSYFLKFSYWKH